MEGVKVNSQSLLEAVRAHWQCNSLVSLSLTTGFGLPRDAHMSIYGNVLRQKGVCMSHQGTIPANESFVQCHEVCWCFDSCDK